MITPTKDATIGATRRFIGPPTPRQSHRAARRPTRDQSRDDDVGPGPALRRSLALGKTARNARVQSLAAAWLAHLDFYVRDDASALEHVALALKLARSDHHGARSRASLVVAGMLLVQRFGRRAGPAADG